MTPFWERKRLADMTPSEWESLCDGCGKCCFVKLREDDDGPVNYTNVACGLLDTHGCRCTDDPNRRRRVPDCVILSSSNLDSLFWMPSTCVYRLIAEGQQLPA